jgi:hypothetical protein
MNPRILRQFLRPRRQLGNVGGISVLFAQKRASRLIVEAQELGAADCLDFWSHNRMNRLGFFVVGVLSEGFCVCVCVYSGGIRCYTGILCAEGEGNASRGGVASGER